MKKIIAFAFCLVFPFAAGCALEDESPPAVDPPADAAPGTPDAAPAQPACGNDVCEDGETIANCEQDCSDGAVCQQNFERWAAWSIKDDMWFDAAYCAGVKQADGTYRAQLVGDCAVEPGDNGSGVTWTNPRTLARRAGQDWSTKLVGNPAECHVTLKGCDNAVTTCPAGSTWNSFLCPGSPVGVGTQLSGPYAWYGDYLGSADGTNELTGNFAFKKNPGGAAEPRGILPCGP